MDTVEKVLSIDASVEPIQALIVEVIETPKDRPQLAVIESVEIPRNQDKSLSVQIIDEVLPQLKTTWDDSVLFIAGDGFVSLNLTLPFADNRRLKKLVYPEVQDIVPFELDLFSVSHSHTCKLNGTGEDIHVSMLPKSQIKAIVDPLKDSAADPRVIATPSATIQSLYELFGHDLEQTSLVAIISLNWVYLGFVVNNKLVADRSIPVPLLMSSVDGIIEGSIQNLERRYEVQFSQVYRLIENPTLNISFSNERTVKDLSMSTLFPNLSKKVSLVALLGAVFGKKYPTPALISNLRQGDFTFRPPLNSLIQGVTSLTPYLLSLVVAITVGLFAWYTGREYQIHSLRQQISTKIKSEVPTFSSDPGKEALTLQSISQGLQDSLKDLGSPLAAPPLMVLGAIAEQLNSMEEISVSRISIQNGQVRIDGSAPNYKSLNKLESEFKKKKNIFCGSKTDSPYTGGKDNSREFQLNLKLCEE